MSRHAANAWQPLRCMGAFLAGLGVPVFSGGSEWPDGERGVATLDRLVPRPRDACFTSLVLLFR